MFYAYSALLTFRHLVMLCCVTARLLLDPVGQSQGQIRSQRSAPVENEQTKNDLCILPDSIETSVFSSRIHLPLFPFQAATFCSGTDNTMRLNPGKQSANIFLEKWQLSVVINNLPFRQSNCISFQSNVLLSIYGNSEIIKRTSSIISSRAHVKWLLWQMSRPLITHPWSALYRRQAHRSIMQSPTCISSQSSQPFLHLQSLTMKTQPVQHCLLRMCHSPACSANTESTSVYWKLAWIEQPFKSLTRNMEQWMKKHQPATQTAVIYF